MTEMKERRMFVLVFFSFQERNSLEIQNAPMK